MIESTSTTTKRVRYNPTVAIVVAMVAGVAAGFIGGSRMTEIQFVGDIFFRLIQMCMVPFVMCQIIEAVGSLTGKQLGSIGAKAVVIFLVSSLLASAFGIFCTVLAQPGAGLASTDLVMSATTDLEGTTTSVQDTIVGFFSSNIFASMADGSMVPCLVFSIFFGIGVSVYRTKIDEDCVAYKAVCEVNEILLTIIRIVMNVAPIGIFAYVSASIGALGLDILIPIGKYILVLFFATLIFTLVWFVVVQVYCKLPITKLAPKMFRMTVLAASTISSAVTLPTEMDDARNKIGISDEVASLVLPLGMPLNSNGSALHMACTAVFVSQMFNMPFEGSMLVYVCVIAWLLSLANAVAPGATLISLTMLMPALGLPLEAVAILGGLEYIVAAIRTTLNVNSDVFSALLVAKSENAIDYDVFNGTKRLDA